MPSFEIGVYNKEIRKLTRVGDHHKDLDDSWENIHYIEITSNDEQQARAKVQSKYPRVQTHSNPVTYEGCKA